MNISIGGFCRIAAAAFFLAGASLAQAEDAPKISAFSTIQSHGSIIPAGDGGYRIVGTVTGPFFIDSGQGPIDAGDLTCVADLKGNPTKGLLDGNGSCVLTAGDGAQLFADFTCSGVPFVGCKGDFTVNGGSGRLEGYTGGGAMTLRTSATELSDGGAMSMTASQGRGIVFWDDFAFTPPAAN